MGRTRGGPTRMKVWLSDQIGKRLPEHVSRIHQKTHFQLVDGLVSDTPVGNPDLWKNPPPKGYSGGRARGNWQSSVGSPIGGETGDIDPNGSATKRANNTAAGRIGFGDVSYITNNVPYINRLNNAPQWSKQQTPMWVQRNIQRVKAQF